MKIEPDNEHTCFCCGSKNEKGLKLEFAYPEPGFAEAECIIPEYFSGWQNITHGGFLAMLMDEVMAHACLSMEKLAVTASMKVRYLKPVNIGTKIIDWATTYRARPKYCDPRLPAFAAILRASHPETTNPPMTSNQFTPSRARAIE